MKPKHQVVIPRQKIIGALKVGGSELADLVLRDFERVYFVAYCHYRDTRQLPDNSRIVLRVVSGSRKVTRAG